VAIEAFHCFQIQLGIGFWEHNAYDEDDIIVSTPRTDTGKNVAKLGKFWKMTKNLFIKINIDTTVLLNKIIIEECYKLGKLLFRQHYLFRNCDAMFTSVMSASYRRVSSLSVNALNRTEAHISNTLECMCVAK